MTDSIATPDALTDMASRNSDEPVYMLNLLKYRTIAAAGAGVDGKSGQAAYEIYGQKFAELNPRFGGEPIWMGSAHASVIGEEDWDTVILVRYPTRQHFLDMLADPDYQAIAPIRAAALADSRLVETSQLMAKGKT
jgi:uncharacterized protein (DUF1330 family)